MDFINTILYPINWLVEAVLVFFHSMLNAVGLDPDSGLIWILSIVGLVIVVRSAIVPLYIHQLKSQRKLAKIAPQIKELQNKYKGKTDPVSKKELNDELLNIYRTAGANPAGFVVPVLIQIPLFVSLFSVLQKAQNGQGGVGFLNGSLSSSFGNSSLFDVAPLHLGILSSEGNLVAVGVAVALVLVMIGSQLFSQLATLKFNLAPQQQTPESLRLQKLLLFVLPLLFVFSGLAFPLGVLFYLVVSTVWTTVQQLVAIRYMPTPGSQADLAKENRLARKRKR